MAHFIRPHCWLIADCFDFEYTHLWGEWHFCGSKAKRCWETRAKVTVVGVISLAMFLCIFLSKQQVQKLWNSRTWWHWFCVSWQSPPFPVSTNAHIWACAHTQIVLELYCAFTDKQVIHVCFYDYLLKGHKFAKWKKNYKFSVSLLWI